LIQDPDWIPARRPEWQRNEKERVLKAWSAKIYTKRKLRKHAKYG